MIRVQVASKAEDPGTGMTLIELERFVSEAASAGAPANTRLRVTLGWRGQIRAIETGEAPEPPPLTVPEEWPQQVTEEQKREER